VLSSPKTKLLVEGCGSGLVFTLWVSPRHVASRLSGGVAAPLAVSKPEALRTCLPRLFHPNRTLQLKIVALIKQNF